MTDLPNYAQPPVVETILVVQFDPLPALQNAHLGVFWKELGQSWPNVDDAPPLEPQFERFTDESLWADVGFKLKLTNAPHCRVQIKNVSGNRMLQIQNGKLVFNWIGLDGKPYPRYEAIRAEAVEMARMWESFVAREHLGEFTPNQWEVTYLNHIPKGTVWNTPEEWTFFKPFGAVSDVETGAKLESYSGQWHFALTDMRGRLHATWQHAKTADSKEVLVLNLTARGPVTKTEDRLNAVFSGLDFGRESIVKFFRSMMTTRANTYWGLENAAH